MALKLLNFFTDVFDELVMMSFFRKVLNKLV